jgi:hypothetical protein
MIIRKLTIEDRQQVEMMDTGIEGDYVLLIFNRLIEHDDLFGLFINDSLVSIAGLTVFGNGYAVLGRLRTDIKFRGNGYATKLLLYLDNYAQDQKHIKWIGLATEGKNKPVRKICKELSLSQVSEYFSCLIETAVLKNIGPIRTGDWEEITCFHEIRKIIIENSQQEHPLNMFPYECYYPLPFERNVFTDDYLSKCKVFIKKDRFVIFMPDEKDRSYLHMKYVCDDIHEQEDLLSIAATLALATNRTLWIDMPNKSAKNLNNLFSDKKRWCMYGKHF